eukprot:4449458-Pyramimonas_sp.AAC.1
MIRSQEKPWSCHPVDAHDRATERAQVWIHIGSEAERGALITAAGFSFDKRKSGKGLTVTRVVPPINSSSIELQPGDVLLPQQGLPDIAHYAVMVCPGWYRFWRPSKAALTTRPNPLFGLTLGLTIAGSVAVDFMHTVALGVMGSIILETMWRAVASNAFADLSLEKTMREQVAFDNIMVKLTEWYSAQRRDGRHPDQITSHSI